MQSVASLQSKQQHATYPNPQLRKSSPRPSPYLFMIDFNIILLSISTSVKLLQSFRFPHQSSVCISLLPRTCYTPRQPRAPWCDPIIAFGAEYKPRRSSLYRVGHKDLPLFDGALWCCSGGREVGVVSCGWLASTVVSTQNGLDRWTSGLCCCSLGVWSL